MNLLQHVMFGTPFAARALPGKSAWYDTSDTATLFQDSALTTPAVADADPVGGWKDKSGNARNATQATSTKRFALKLAIQNGRPVLRPDGVDDFLSFANLTLSALTILAVVKTQTGANGTIVGGSAASGQPFFFFDPTGKLALNNDNVLALGTSTNALAAGMHAVAVTYNSPALAFFVDGVSAGSASVATSFTSPVNQIGVEGATGGFPLNSDIGELCICTRALSAGELAGWSKYAKNKWGTP